MIDRPAWDEISLEVILAARESLSIKDFELRCRLAPTLNGKSYFDRIRVAESLIREGVISEDEGHLRLTRTEVPETLVEDLLAGSEVAWTILESINPPPKVIRKLDTDLLKKIGLDGELAVIETLKSQISEQSFNKIRHISLKDDSAGFDIQAPSSRDADAFVLLEVKTSVRPGELFSFYISANEARVGRLNRNWFLIGVESFKGDLRVFGHLLFETFSDLLPLNQSESCEWQSAKVSISKKAFRHGLP